jgi:anti-sigma factor RsiW
MTCREFAEFIDEYDAGGLAGDARIAFERHLSLCVNCQRYLSQYRATIALGRAAFDELDTGVPENVPEDLIAAILAARKH